MSHSVVTGAGRAQHNASTRPTHQCPWSRGGSLQGAFCQGSAVPPSLHKLQVLQQVSGGSHRHEALKVTTRNCYPFINYYEYNYSVSVL